MGYFLQEIAIVVIGVLIAVSISNYKEKIDNENFIEKTLLAIENEIALSQTDLDTVLNKHQGIFEFVKDHREGNEQALGEMIGTLGGIQSASIKNISLRFFVANKAELVDFELISQLSEIESNTDILSEKMKRLVDFIYENIDHTEESVKLKFAYFLANVIDTEKSLLELYEDFLAENKAYLQQ